MEIKKFIIEEDKVNKGSKLLVAIAKDDSKWIVCGNPHFPTALIPYEDCYYTQVKK